MTLSSTYLSTDALNLITYAGLNPASSSVSKDLRNSWLRTLEFIFNNCIQKLLPNHSRQESLRLIHFHFDLNPNDFITTKIRKIFVWIACPVKCSPRFAIEHFPTSISTYEKCLEKDILTFWKKLPDSKQALSELKITSYSQLSDQFTHWMKKNKDKLLNVKTLYLAGCSLSHIPPQIFELQNLQTLNLKDNQLQMISPEIGKLLKLIKLDLNNNLLRKVPIEIGNLPNLQFLYLKNNEIEAIPKEFGKLCNLRWLILSNNKLQIIPKEIINLPKLQHFQLGKNKPHRKGHI